MVQQLLLLLLQQAGGIIQLDSGHIIDLDELKRNRIFIKIAPTAKRHIVTTKDVKSQPKKTAPRKSNDSNNIFADIIANLRQRQDDLLLWKEFASYPNEQLEDMFELIFQEDEEFAKRLIDFLVSKRCDWLAEKLIEKLQSGSAYEKALSLHGLNSTDSSRIGPIVRGLLKDSDQQLQLECIRYLTRNKDSASISDIFMLWPETELSDAVAQSMEFFMKNGYKDKVISLLGEHILEHEYAEYVTEFIVKHKIRDLDKQMLELAGSRNAKQKLAALRAGAKLAIPGIADELNRVLMSWEDKPMLEAAIDISKYVKIPENNRLLVELLKHEDPTIKMAAGTVLRFKTGLNLPSDYDKWKEKITNQR